METVGLVGLPGETNTGTGVRMQGLAVQITREHNRRLLWSVFPNSGPPAVRKGTVDADCPLA